MKATWRQKISGFLSKPVTNRPTRRTERSGTAKPRTVRKWAPNSGPICGAEQQKKPLQDKQTSHAQTNHRHPPVKPQKILPNVNQK
jgi:hypothetical protein